MSASVLKTIKQVKRVIIAVIGFSVLLIGAVMIVLPGPAFIVIPIGVGILATEFVWARRLLKRVGTGLHKKNRDFNHSKETE